MLFTFALIAGPAAGTLTITVSASGTMEWRCSKGFFRSQGGDAPSKESAIALNGMTGYEGILRIPGGISLGACPLHTKGALEIKMSAIHTPMPNVGTWELIGRA